MKYLGYAYYPEYWGVECVAVDAKLMHASGIPAILLARTANIPAGTSKNCPASLPVIRT